MFPVFLVMGLSARQLDLPKFVKGKWNATIHHLTPEGTLFTDPATLKWEFRPRNGSFAGTVTGFPEPFNVTVSVDDQSFRITGSDGTLAESQFEYAKRNLPIARGRWNNGSFTIVVFTGTTLELTIFSSDCTVLIYRLAKTVVPDITDALRTLALPMGIGVLVLVYRMWSIHQYIVEKERSEAQKKSTALEEKKEGEKEKQD
jgi:hypothetical protein